MLAIARLKANQLSGGPSGFSLKGCQGVSGLRGFRGFGCGGSGSV